MDFERRTIPEATVLTLAEAKQHLRVDLTDEDALVDDLIVTATREVEDFAQVALIEQTIRAQFLGPIKVGAYRLPIGPVLDGASATVTMIEPDGTATALGADFFTLVAGRAARLWVVEDPALPALLGEADTVLRIDYPAGFGTSAADVPHDLRHAVRDQVAHLYELRGGYGEPRHAKPMSSNAIRIAQRYRRTSV